MSAQPLLLTGGSSYLGRQVARLAADRGPLYATYHTQPDQVPAGRPVPLDVTDRTAVFGLVEQVRPAAIIHAAALNPGQGSEAEMMAVNAEGSRIVAQAAVAVGARLVHVSTDVVHDGQNAPYHDEAPPAPLNAYGRSKAAAEAAVAEVAPGAAIVRTSLIYGLEEMDRGTAGFVARLARGETLTLFIDVIRQPVWVDALAAALLELTALEFAGRLNVAGAQPLTREAFGRRMLDWWGVELGDRVQAGRAADISAAVPLDLRLTLDKAESLLSMRLPGVDEILAAASGSASSLSS